MDEASKSNACMNELFFGRCARLGAIEWFQLRLDEWDYPQLVFKNPTP
jgi:hypothetical protein